MKNEKEECSGALWYTECPVCGLPIHEGRCPAGHPWEVRTVKLTELTEFFAQFDLQVTHLEIVDASEAYYDLEERWVTFLISNIYEAERNQREPLVDTTVYMDHRYAVLDWAREAISEILVEYIYRRECKNSVKVVERFGPRKVERKQYTFRDTPTRIHYLREAARYYGTTPGKLIEAHARAYHADEVEGEEVSSQLWGTFQEG